MFASAVPDPARIASAQQSFAAVAQGWRAVARRSDAGVRAEAEVQVFNQMVVALAGWFAPLDCAVGAELRLLALGITRWNGFFPQADDGAAQITGYTPGDRIRITEALFSRLAAAYLAGLAAKPR